MSKKKKSKQIYYRQCQYECDHSAGKRMGISWLPESLAEVGKTIFFGSKDQKNKKFWTITSVGKERKSETYLKDHERDYLSQREASDI